jgi:hypothetical protein
LRVRRARILGCGGVALLALAFSAADAQAALRLLSPRQGAVLSQPPLLRWAGAPAATHYNVQLWRDGRKVLSRWPERAQLQLRRFWRYKGHWYSLRPARYRWFVWPGYRWGYGRYRTRTFIFGRRPVNTAVPTVAGEPREGRSLTASRGKWTGTRPLSFSYQWRRCRADGSSCANIPGATSATLHLGAAEIDRTVRVVVRATNLAGSRAVSSAETAVVLAAPPVNVSIPRLSGAFQTGRLLTAARGAWKSSRPVTFSFRWRRCDRVGEVCRTITRARAAAYRLRFLDFERRVRVIVRAENAGGVAYAASRVSPLVGRVFLGAYWGELLRGSIGADVIRAGAGNDRVVGGLGNDRIIGGLGADTIYAGPGSDVVFTRDGWADRVLCGRGRDVAVAERRDIVGADCESVRVP